MEINVYELVSKDFLLMLFLVIGCGYVIGKLKIGSIEVGSTTGVLVAGLLFGYAGFQNPPGAASFGFTLFIFSVGLQAGPSFFSVFLQDGAKYFVLAAVVAACALGLAWLMANLIGLEFGLAGGLLAGGLTSTPTLAAAQDAVSSGLASLPDGMTAAKAASNVSVAYAITYIFGTIGLILFVNYFPVIFGINLPKEAAELAAARGLLGGGGDEQRRRDQLPIIRAYRITEEQNAARLTVGEVQEGRGRSFAVLKVRRGNQILDNDSDLTLELGDVVSVVARLGAIEDARELLGQEVLDPDLLDYQIVTREIVVVTGEGAGKTIGQLKMNTRYGCFPTLVRRASIELQASDNLLLQKGDRLESVGEETGVERLAERIGYIEEELKKTDLLTFSFGISIGIILGMLVIKFGAFSIGLGSAGGLLLGGIVIGYVSSLHPTFGHVPEAARAVLMDLGLMLFMASVGLSAGDGIVEALAAVGLPLIGAGIVLTLTPVLVGYAFGRYVFKLNPALLLGSITGAMTSTPALNIVTSAAKSSIPALGYAGTYTFANVFLTFAGTLIMTI